MLSSLKCQGKWFGELRIPSVASLGDRTWNLDALVEVLDVQSFRSIFLRGGHRFGSCGRCCDGLLFWMWYCGGHDGSGGYRKRGLCKRVHDQFLAERSNAPPHISSEYVCVDYPEQHTALLVDTDLRLRPSFRRIHPLLTT